MYFESSKKKALIKMKKMYTIDIIRFSMWFYLYLITTSFYHQMGFHMWGYTTDVQFSYQKMASHLGHYLSKSNDSISNSNYTDLYYHAVYKMPSKFIAFPFERLIAPPHYYLVRDDLGLEWYKISTSHLESIFSNASIPVERIETNEQEKVWNHTEL